ncbi:uncharacterized protein HGUI_01449 [Hanseniaspora guilliermondii]|uniref:Prokaryotic-type class I peptide chain release factors domain-containing protein n=1 Tax=Hanseniaspora guilliermondii TaxID=56406 RepID=A0A1L0CLG6_9ASCO|nr:uncharacterized protein HGUI_01449 [Hanseniaspora guilliermondii]
MIHCKRFIHTQITLHAKRVNLPPRVRWDPKLETEIEEKFLYGGPGNGGQALNRTASRVQIKHIPTGIVVTNQFSRSQKDNRKKAREILAEKLEALKNSNGQGNGMGMSDRKLALLQKKKEKKENRERNAAKKYKKLDSEREIKKAEQAAKENELLMNIYGKKT